jgi:hypothetical protein
MTKTPSTATCRQVHIRVRLQRPLHQGTRRSSWHEGKVDASRSELRRLSGDYGIFWDACLRRMFGPARYSRGITSKRYNDEHPTELPVFAEVNGALPRPAISTCRTSYGPSWGCLRVPHKLRVERRAHQTATGSGRRIPLARVGSTGSSRSRSRSATQTRYCSARGVSPWDSGSGSPSAPRGSAVRPRSP